MTTLRPHPRASILCALAGAALTGPLGPGACGGVTDPAPTALPSGAVAFTAPPVYARWWALTEACAGRSGDHTAVRWYVVPGAATVALPSGGEAAAYAAPAERRVVLAGRYAEAGALVRHEMLHLLLGADVTGHPPAYFQGLCEGVVACAAVGCRDEGAPAADAPPDAATVAVAALDVRVEVTPSPASRGAADPWVQVTVRATNTGAAPVWVRLDPPAGGGAREAGGFGYELAPAAAAGVVAGERTALDAGRVAFAAGRTRRHVFDVKASELPAGEYVARGFYNTGAASSPFRVVP